MEGKNCPNCGAVYTLEDVKCPYCGTLYFDMTAIDFTDNKPVFLKMRLPYGSDNMMITQCAIPRLDSIEFNNNYADAIDCRGNIVKRFCTGMTGTTNIHFDAIQYGQNRKMFEVKYE